MHEIYNGSHMSNAIRVQEPSIYHIAAGMEHFGFVLNKHADHVTVALLSTLTLIKRNNDAQRNKKNDLRLVLGLSKKDKIDLESSYKFAFYDTRLHSISYILPQHIVLHSADPKFIEVKKSKPSSYIVFVDWLLRHCGFQGRRTASTNVQNSPIVFLDVVKCPGCIRLAQFPANQVIVISNNSINCSKPWLLLAFLDTEHEVVAISAVEKNLASKEAEFDEDTKLEYKIRLFLD